MLCFIELSSQIPTAQYNALDILPSLNEHLGIGLLLSVGRGR